MDPNSPEYKIGFLDEMLKRAGETIDAQRKMIDAKDAELDRLRERNARLKGALRQADCPYSIDGDDGTVGPCVDNGHCGCIYGAALEVE